MFHEMPHDWFKVIFYQILNSTDYFVMTALFDVAGLPISIDVEVENVIYDQGSVVCGSSKCVSLKELVPALLNKALRYPENVYKHHEELSLVQDKVTWPNSYKYDIIYIPAGLLGIEYIKTHIFFHAQTSLAACVVQVLMGTLTVIMQKNKPKEDKFDMDTHVQEAKIIKVKHGQKLAIPAGYLYTFINTEEMPVVFARVIAHEHIANYQELNRENGMGYYLIAKNARQEIVANPRYRTLAEVKKVSVDVMNAMSSYIPNYAASLYTEVKDGLGDFDRLLNF